MLLNVRLRHLLFLQPEITWKRAVDSSSLEKYKYKSEDDEEDDEEEDADDDGVLDDDYGDTAVEDDDY